MPLKLQRRTPRRSIPALAGGGNEQYGELRSRIEDSAVEVRNLKGELHQLRFSQQALANRLDQLQNEFTGLQRQATEMSGTVSGLGEKFAALTQAFEEGTRALTATTQALEARQAEESRLAADLAAILQRQHADMTTLAGNLTAVRERIEGRLGSLLDLEVQTVHASAELSATCQARLQGLETDFRRALESLAVQMQEFATGEQHGLEALVSELVPVAQASQESTRLLHAVDTSLRQIAEQSGRVLEQQRRETARSALQEAGRLNGLGLRRLAEGHPEEAVRFFVQAVTEAPDSFEPSFNLLVARAQLGELATVREALPELIRKHPDREEARRLHAELTRPEAAALGALAALWPASGAPAAASP